MATHRTRREKVAARHSFLYSWQPSGTDVKRESKLKIKSDSPKSESTKNPNILAQEPVVTSVKTNILKSLIIISFVLILEVVIYLALAKFT